MRRVSSVPTRAPSPLYTPSPPASRQPLRTSLGSPYGSPIVSEPRPLPSLFPGTTLPPASSHAPDPVHSSYLGRHGNGTGSESGSPTLLRAGMTAQPQQYGTLGKHDTRAYDNTHSSFGTRAYDIFERMVLSRPDSLTGELYTQTVLLLLWIGVFLWRFIGLGSVRLIFLLSELIFYDVTKDFESSFELSIHQTLYHGFHKNIEQHDLFQLWL